ncbi:hypothetical protein RJT34_20256 [Clitoria ternatea]|uniref:PPM-type phosphatase domain-containing protein n=1 Tax=Clitoria ternatea TaxID=43366 RepID=A0AAN9P4R0_CLITE
MLSWVSHCCSSFRCFPDISSDDEGSYSSSNVDLLVWRRGLDKHSSGEFSFVMVQANKVIKDHSQVEIGSDAFFVEVYDGHSGPNASSTSAITSSRISLSLDPSHSGRAQGDGNISKETIRSLFAATKDGFMTAIRRGFEIKPVIVGVGSCVLISRSIGDAFLKWPEFWLDSSVLQPTDKFLIFASDGLWENLTNEEAGDCKKTYKGFCKGGNKKRE